jgi:hypothetical protein
MRHVIVAAVVLLLGASATARAGIVRIEITRVESPTFEGRAFGTVGQYEKLAGVAYGEIDPADPLNAVITDIALAPRNARGCVEYTAAVYILRPVDPAKANGRVIFDLTNRGFMTAIGFMNDMPLMTDPTAADDAGNGFLMRRGYTILVGGWDASVTPGGGRFTIRVPTAKNADGSSIEGVSLQEFVTDAPMTVGALSYPAATLDKAQATLTVRMRYDDPPIVVPADQWQYVNANGIRLVGTSFTTGRLYEFTYPAKDPMVFGIGFAAIRDIAAFVRRPTALGEVGALLAGGVRAIYSFCYSQPCRAMNDFLQFGFNQDEAGGVALDGVLSWAGGASGIFLNHRFAQPSRTHRQHIGRWYPELQFPFAPQEMHDPATGKTDGRLRTCLATGTCPRILALNSENEYWSKNMAVWHTDMQGNDLADAPGVRSYLLAGVAHTGPVGPTGKGMCQQTLNPLVANPVLRALLVALDAWVTSDIEPPSSRLPRVADGTLVPSLPQWRVGFPSIPGVTYNGRMHAGELFDFGPLFGQGIMSVLPPTPLGTPYFSAVPATDQDGNDIAGIRLPDVEVPLATYTGWGLRALPPGVDEGCDHYGQKIDFLETKAERLASGDPRLSIQERYFNHGTYVNAEARAAGALMRGRLLLPEDFETYVMIAAESSIGKR